MKFQLKVLACAVLSCTAFGTLAANAAAPTYDAVYVFGDSYCDVGNLYIATGGATPAAPNYYQGRFSNGPLWLDHVASYLGLPMKPSLAGGTNYAFAGAWASQPQVTAAGTIPDIPQQVAEYLSKHHGKADPKAVYIIEGGGADILFSAGTGVSPEKLAWEIASSISDSEQALRRAGARHFLIANLFDLGNMPVAASFSTWARTASLAVNEDLIKQLAPEYWIPGMDMKRLDIYHLMYALDNSSTHFGFVELVNPCLNVTTGAVCADPDHTFFWDAVSPTEFVEGYLAVMTENTIDQ